MNKLSILKQLRKWIFSKKCTKCHFEENFYQEIEEGWNECQGTMSCNKCGKVVTFKFNFRKN